MAKFPFPWYRVAVFTVLIALLAWWIHARDLQVVEEEPVPAPRPGIGTPEGQSVPVVAFDIFPHETPEGEMPMFWLRVGNVAYDVQLPLPGTDPELARQAHETRESVLETLGEELHDLRREAPDPDVVIGEVRRGQSVPSALYMEAFQLFIEAGYGKVNMVLTDAKPPGRPPR